MAERIRLPQRFQWMERNGGPWLNGIVVPSSDVDLGERWHIRSHGMFGSFDDDPWEVMGQILGDIADLRWIDNDYGWQPKSATCCGTVHDSADDLRRHLKECHS